MSCLQTSALAFSSSRCSKMATIKAVNIQDPKLIPKVIRFASPTTTKKLVSAEQASSNDVALKTTTKKPEPTSDVTSTATAELHAILEAVSDRVQMHDNIGKQRDNWNALFLSSLNTITLTATALAGVSAAAGAPAGESLSALNLSSAVLFSAAAGISTLMSKIQPSQLAEEQRNASRLFRKLRTEIETALALRSPSETDVSEAMEKILSLDRAFPLPLLGAMLEKYPERFEPAVWWPRKSRASLQSRRNGTSNGWGEETESEMREIVEVLKSKDREDYERLGNLVLKTHKTLAVLGPLLSGIAAMSVGHGGSLAAVAAGAAASAVHALELGGQVGMVFEMYRNCGGYFKLMEETIEDALEEKDCEERENGELFRMKVALQLGRSLPQMSEIAAKSELARLNGTVIDEFASKLF